MPLVHDYPEDVRTAMDDLLGRDRRRALVFGLVFGGLLLGFAVAQATGNRPLGAIVLIGAGVAAAVLMWRSGGRWSVAIAGLVYAAAFALSHPLGTIIGAIPAVLLVSLLSGAIAFELTPRVGGKT